MLHVLWPSDPATCPTTLPPPLPKRHREPKPFAGLTTKPHCDACEHATAAPRPQAPSAPPPRIVPTRGRPRQVETSRHFCPYPDCAYQGWAGWGNLRANGHPVVYLHPADKYHRLTRRPSQGQKGIDERALMASKRPLSSLVTPSKLAVRTHDPASTHSNPSSLSCSLFLTPPPAVATAAR